MFCFFCHKGEVSYSDSSDKDCPNRRAHWATVTNTWTTDTPMMHHAYHCNNWLSPVALELKVRIQIHINKVTNATHIAKNLIGRRWVSTGLINCGICIPYTSRCVTSASSESHFLFVEPRVLPYIPCMSVSIYSFRSCRGGLTRT